MCHIEIDSIMLLKNVNYFKAFTSISGMQNSIFANIMIFYAIYYTISSTREMGLERL